MHWQVPVISNYNLPPVVTCNVDCGVIFQLNERDMHANCSWSGGFYRQLALVLLNVWMKTQENFSSVSFVCRQWTLGTLACKVSLLANLLVPPWDFPFLASSGMVIKNIWRSKKCEVEQHNTNSADKIFCVKEITTVYTKAFSKLWYFVLELWSSVYVFQAISHCRGKLTPVQRGF